MKAETHKLIEAATKALSLSDVILFNARFERPSPPTGELTQEQKSGVRYSVLDAEIDGEQNKILQSIVDLGVRLVAPAEKEDDDGAEALVVEARFVVNFLITGSISDAAVEAFARFNAVHVAWPFWRQHVFDVCQRGHLPILEVPLRPGLPSE